MHASRNPDEASERAFEIALPLLDDVNLTHDERHALALTAAGDNASLRAEVVALLNDLSLDHRPTGATQVRHALQQVGDDDSDATPTNPGTSGTPMRPVAALDGVDPFLVTGFELLGRLGDGAQGVVYLARQLDPQRIVALKTLHPTAQADPKVEGESDLAFRVECAMQARLDHPGLARLIDSGRWTDEQGRSRRWIASQLAGRAHRRDDGGYDIEGGEPLDQFAARTRPGLRARLALLADIAHAVGAAHMAGAAHLDLKPDNILIRHDGKPCVIDFGLARLRGDVDDNARRVGLTLAPESAALTALAGVGTPLYMAPEQVDPTFGVIGRATDVWALGVIAYELLTHELPLGLDPHTSLFNVANAICRGAFVPPSRLKSKPGNLGLMAGDIDAILRSALRRDPADRYELATWLGDDLNAALHHRPVRARKGRRLYHATKFVLRHRLAVTTAALVMLGASGLLTTTLYQKNRAERALVVAIQETDRANQEANRAEAQREVAENEARVSREALAFFDRMFQAATPAVAQGETVLASDLLDASLADLDYADLPREVAGPVRLSLGEALMSLGEPDRAADVLRDSLRPGDSDAHRIDVYLALANVHDVDQRSKLTSDEHADLVFLVRQLDFGDQRRLLADYITTKRRLAGPALVVAMDELLDRHEQSLGDTHAQTLKLGVELGVQHSMQGDNVAALVLLEAAEPLAGEHLGPGHPVTTLARHELAYVLEDVGRLDDAEALYKRTLADIERVYGKSNFRYEITLANYAFTFLAREDWQGYYDTVAESRQLSRARLPEDHPRVMHIDQNYATALNYLERFEESYALMAELLPRRERVLGQFHVETIRTRAGTGYVLMELGRYDEAETLLALAVEQAKFNPQMGPGHASTQLYERQLQRCRDRRENEKKAGIVEAVKAG